MKSIPALQEHSHNISVACDEAMLWDDFKCGDKDAYASIYEKYSDSLFNYGMQIANNSNLVEDAIQDLFVEMWRSRENLASVKSIKFYLFTCLRRGILKNIKKESKIFSINTILEKQLNSSSSVEDDILEEEFLAEKTDKIQKVLSGLGKRQREILYLKFFENQSYQQIAQLLGLDLKYIYNTASKAYNIIKKNLN